MAEQKRERSLEVRNPYRDFGWGLSRIFDDLFSERGAPMARWAPALDVTETPEAYVVSVELPGAKSEDVGIEIQENALVIRGEKKSEREEKNEKRHYVERTYGSFARSFTLPPNVDPDRIKASFKDGVLAVEIPKTAEQKPRVIDIKKG
jgi:HSP20 family protein